MRKRRKRDREREREIATTEIFTKEQYLLGEQKKQYVTERLVSATKHFGLDKCMFKRV